MAVEQKKPDDIVVPFLKWAGGKRWLVEKHPDLFSTQFERYFEPFLGSGAVFFSVAPTSSVISDCNSELIEVYQAIKGDWSLVYDYLEHHHRLHSKEYYYEIRDLSPKIPAERAARFIYLNRTCWNGLYRVNLNGRFNVPIGTKKNVILDSDNFSEISSVLSNAEILNSDFEPVIDKAGEGDFVFVDPPYTVKHNHNGFVKYNENLFSWDDQVRLRDCVERALNRNAKVLVTNAAHESIYVLYKGIGEFCHLSRRSSISGRADRRGIYEELVVKCL